MAKIDEIFEKLEAAYPDAHCELDYETPFELLVAVMLSAQCTDRRVNLVTKELFARYSTPAQFAALSPAELEPLIYSCGFYRNKAANIIAASRAITDKHGGEVPTDFDALLSLPGVGRKTANVVRDVAFGGDGIPVDTHVFRTCNRLGIAEGKTPFEVETALEKVLPVGTRGLIHHLLIFHGRYCCKAISPKCDCCPLTEQCKYHARLGENNNGETK